MSQRNAHRAIARAQAALDNGHPDQAIKALRTALALAPGEPLAAALLASALILRGQLQDAQHWLAMALRTAPQEPKICLVQGQWLLACGRAAEAQPLLAALVQRVPDFADGFVLLGDASLACKAIAAARAAYARAQALRPKDGVIALKLARAHAAAGDFAAAEAELAAARGVDLDARLALKAEWLIAGQRWAALATLADQWCRAQPQAPAAWRMAAIAAFEEGRFEAARQATQAMLGLGAGGAADWAAYGQIALQALNFAEAERAFAKAEALASDLPEVLGGKARLLTFLGRRAEAEACCRRALAADPARGDLWWLLCLQIAGAFTAAERAQLQRLAAQPDLAAEQRAMAALALGQGLEAAGEIDAAAAAYAHGHALKRAQALRQGTAYDRSHSEAHFSALRRAFVSATPRALVWETRPRPIFIFGMPRSGTTLVEALLAAQPGVLDCGEHPRLQQLLRTVLSHIGKGGPLAPEQWQAWAQAYFADLPLRPDVLHVIDKNPLNFQAAGLIAQLFPDAVMIHMTRDALEVGLSIWRHEFSGWGFTDRLEDIGHFYGQYQGLMQHFAEVVGPRLIAVRYETFAADYAVAAPALLAQIGLDGDARAAAPDQPIATLSAVQVRRAIAPAPPRAAIFGHHLDPLRHALHAAGVL